MSAGTLTGRWAVVVARWAARLWAAALVLFWGAFFVEHLAWFADPQRLPPPWVFLLVGLTVGILLALRATGGAPRPAVRAAAWLLVLELAQGLIGFVQYFTNLPIVLVGFHMLGAALISAVMARLLLEVRERPGASGE